MSRRVIALLAILGLALSACGTAASPPPGTSAGASAGADASEPAQTDDGTVSRELRVSTPAEILSVDPAYDNSGLGQAVLRNIFDPLVERDETGTIVGVAAESWEVLSDTVWEFKLREGMTFHNGDPVTSEDVAFTINRILDESNESPLAPFISAIQEAEAVDPSTVHIITARPYTALLVVLPSAPIVPKSVIEEIGEDEFAAAPIGSGPYQFVEWLRDDHLTVEAYNDYWAGAPSIQEVIFRPITEPGTRAAALQNDEVDLVMDFPEQFMGDVEGRDDVDIVVGTGMRTHQIIIDSTVEPFTDVRVRQAVQHAIDYEALIETVLGGIVTRNCQVISPDTFGHDPDLQCPGFDADLARQLLADAGYPDGIDVEMGGATGARPHDSEVQEAVVAMLGDVGIRVDLSLLEATRWVEGYAEREWPMTYHTNAGPGDMEYVFGFGFYSETSRGYWNDPAGTDPMIDASRAEFDPGAREEILQEISRHLVEQAAWVVIHNQADIWGLNADLDYVPIPEKLNMARASWK